MTDLDSARLSVRVPVGVWTEPGEDQGNRGGRRTAAVRDGKLRQHWL